MARVHLAVLGSPIQHSKSPLIHAAAYEQLGLDWDYGRYDVSTAQFEGFLALRDETWRGLSITMPLKEIATTACSALSPTAVVTGSANTLLNTGGAWLGFNTDVFGIQKAVSEAVIGDVGTVAIIGSGATARSAAFAMHQMFPSSSLSIHARDEAKANALLDGLGIAGKTADFESLSDYDLTISTLPKGIFKPGGKQRGALLDVAYDPWPSPASANYERAISGLEMLLWQAIAQVRIFTSGDELLELPDEAEVLSAMRASL